MVVDAVMSLDTLLPLNMIGMKKVQGGALEVSALLFIRSRLVMQLQYRVLFVDTGLSADHGRSFQEDLQLCWF